MAKSLNTVKNAEKASEKYTVAGSESPVYVAPKARPSRFNKPEEVEYKPSGKSISPWSPEYFAKIDHEVALAQEGRRKAVVVVPRPVDSKKLLADILGGLDEIIDSVFEKKIFPKVNVSAMLKEHSFVTSEHVEIIRSNYTKQRQEIQDALDKTDEQLVEGYDFLTPVQKRKIIEFYDTIVNGCDEYENLTQRRKTLARKVRIKKPASAAKQIKTLKFLQESDVYNVVSIQPELIIGAMVLWTFNTTNKKLTQYIAADRGGFKVKGCTLLNIDEKLSVTKTLRKPEETLKAVINGGKIQLRKLMDMLTTKPSVTNGRINANIVILKAEK